MAQRSCSRYSHVLINRARLCQKQRKKRSYRLRCCEPIPSRVTLSRDVFESFTGVESDSFILVLVEGSHYDVDGVV